MSCQRGSALIPGVTQVCRLLFANVCFDCLSWCLHTHVDHVRFLYLGSKQEDSVPADLHYVTIYSTCIIISFLSSSLSRLFFIFLGVGWKMLRLDWHSTHQLLW